MSAPTDRETSATLPPAPEAARDGAGLIGVVRQWLGTSGRADGTSGDAALVFLYGFGMAAVLVGVVNTINVITIVHDFPAGGLFYAAVDEGSSYLTLLLFFWIPWLAWCAAPPLARPRWRLIVHAPAALAYSLAHVAGFVAVRKLAWWLAGHHYDFGPFWSEFAYEFRKDALGYALFVASFSLVAHFLARVRQGQPAAAPATFDIRDGAKLVRVRVGEILAVSSAGNYAEFVLADGRKPLMRMTLSALETELGPRGFVRTHRSWLVNAAHVTALTPDGSGDYTVGLPALSVPLSRRFPEALARLRAPNA